MKQKVAKLVRRGEDPALHRDAVPAVHEHGRFTILGTHRQPEETFGGDRILRMADLLALQPNMDIRLHIVAPDERRSKVFEEILRPVFSLLEGRPLSERCTFLSYDSVRELSQVQHLSHLSDSVLGEYEDGLTTHVGRAPRPLRSARRC